MVSLTLMKMLAMTLKIDYEQHFAAFCNDSLQAIILLHYPHQLANASDRQFGTGAHTDFGAVTCLLTGDIAGLQVESSGLNRSNVANRIMDIHGSVRINSRILIHLDLGLESSNPFKSGRIKSNTIPLIRSRLIYRS